MHTVQNCCLGHCLPCNLLKAKWISRQPKGLYFQFQLPCPVHLVPEGEEKSKSNLNGSFIREAKFSGEKNLLPHMSTHLDQPLARHPDNM